LGLELAPTERSSAKGDWIDLTTTEVGPNPNLKGKQPFAPWLPIGETFQRSDACCRFSANPYNPFRAEGDHESKETSNKSCFTYANVKHPVDLAKNKYTL